MIKWNCNENMAYYLVIITVIQHTHTPEHCSPAQQREDKRETAEKHLVYSVIRREEREEKERELEGSSVGGAP